MFHCFGVPAHRCRSKVMQEKGFPTMVFSTNSAPNVQSASTPTRGQTGNLRLGHCYQPWLFQPFDELALAALRGMSCSQGWGDWGA